MSAIFSFGEILWDIFPDYKKPGGSPANLAYHLHVLKNESYLISRVGDDEYGRELLNFIRKKGLTSEYIQKDPENPTGTVTVQFDGDEPSYTIHEPAAWDYIEVNTKLEKSIANSDALCFASLSQRNPVSAASLNQLLDSVSENCLTVFDLNLRPPFVDRDRIKQCIHRSKVIKFNMDEMKQVSEWFETDQLADDLLRADPDKVILLTLGGDGSAMYTRDGYVEQKAFPISNGGDFVGVGDAFLACITHLLLKDEKPEQILLKANRYAAEVASSKGGMPDISDEVIEEILG
ncbi:MAG: carbohydrate kinase [Balneolaceae bacterium]|nr:carbohydrate kinase [Balneolaceae bacterium]